MILDHDRRTDDPETTIIILYRKGITIREITDLIEKIYDQHYSPATMPNISKAVAEHVETFHKQPLSERYVVIFMDVTYLNVRRDSVAEDPLHVLAGITPYGLEGMRDAVKRQFPDADHRQCRVYLSRTVSGYIRNRDCKENPGDFKSVYHADSEKSAGKALDEFLKKHGKRYPKLKGILKRPKKACIVSTSFGKQS